MLLLCSNHVDPLIGNHSKIISLPLGIRNRAAIFNKIAELTAMKVNKTRLLLINNSGWRERAIINAQISQAFNGTVKNTYNPKSKRDHYRDVSESVFVLAPSGLGFDTYRLWEAIALGSIPIVESNAGFDRSYSNLPVLVVRNYSDVNVDLLKRAYNCFCDHSGSYRYDHLLRSYWIDMIHRATESASIGHISINHPFQNKYCNFL